MFVMPSPGSVFFVAEHMDYPWPSDGWDYCGMGSEGDTLCEQVMAHVKLGLTSCRLTLCADP